MRRNTTLYVACFVTLTWCYSSTPVQQYVFLSPRNFEVVRKIKLLQKFQEMDFFEPEHLLEVEPSDDFKEVVPNPWQCCWCHELAV